MSHPYLTVVARERIQNVLRVFSSLDYTGAVAKLIDVKPELQNGPQCGLVALHMAAAHFYPENQIEMENLFEYVKSEGYSKQGEMFSAVWLADIAKKIWPSIEMSTQDVLSGKELVRILDIGALVLMPYDCDKNHEPIKLNGHNAHWCIIVGYLHPSKREGLLWKETISDLCEVVEDETLYVFCFHGKSKHLAVWKYFLLCESNFNLREVSSKRLNGDYVVPSINLDELREKCIVLNPGH